MKSIIERDIEFYESEVQRCRNALQNCFPDEETMWKAHLIAAETVYNSLIDYWAVISHYSSR